MKIILLVIFVIYIAAIVVSGVRTGKKFAGRPVVESQRMEVYRQSMITSWISSFFIALTALMGGFTPAALGIRLPVLDAFLDHYVFSIIAILAGAAALILMMVQCFRLALSKSYRAEAWAQLSKGGDSDVLKDFASELIIPRSRRERRLFPFVVFTASVCEEFIMRGVSFALILSFCPQLSPFLLPFLSAVLFGAGHIYQGASGMVKTTAAGLLFGVIYLATGSLFPVMVLHFIIDLNSQFIAPGRGKPR